MGPELSSYQVQGAKDTATCCTRTPPASSLVYRWGKVYNILGVSHSCVPSLSQSLASMSKKTMFYHQVTGILPAPFRVSFLGTDVPTPLASTPFHVVPETVKCWGVTGVEPRVRCSGSLEGTVSCSNGQGCRGTGC